MKPRMPKVIAVLNQKGGVGKTTTSVNLSVCLALKGLRVCVIDMDPQSNTSEDFGALNWSGVLSNDILNRSTDKKKKNGELDLFTYDVPGGHPITVFPSDIDLESVALMISTITFREKILKDFIHSNGLLRNLTDYIIIDCAPSLNPLTINSIYAATNFLIPIDCSRHALKGMGALLKTISMVKEKDDFKDFWILLNEVDQREKILNSVLMNQLLVDNLSDNLLKTQIRNLSSINKSIFRGIPISLTQDIGATCFISLADEIIKRCSND